MTVSTTGRFFSAWDAIAPQPGIGDIIITTGRLKSGWSTGELVHGWRSGTAKDGWTTGRLEG